MAIIHKFKKTEDLIYSVKNKKNIWTMCRGCKKDIDLECNGTQIEVRKRNEPYDARMKYEICSECLMKLEQIIPVFKRNPNHNCPWHSSCRDTNDNC